MLIALGIQVVPRLQRSQSCLDRKGTVKNEQANSSVSSADLSASGAALATNGAGSQPAEAAQPAARGRLISIGIRRPRKLFGPIPHLHSSAAGLLDAHRRNLVPDGNEHGGQYQRLEFNFRETG